MVLVDCGGSGVVFLFVRVIIVFSTGCVLVWSVHVGMFLFASYVYYFLLFPPRVIILFSASNLQGRSST